MLKKLSIILIQFFLILCVLSGGAWANEELSQTFVLNGQLYNSTFTSTLADVVDFKFQIYDPSGSCLLYEEFQRVDLTESEGEFSVEVGSKKADAKRTNSDPGFSLSEIFQNSTSLDPPDSVCSGLTYTPVFGENRLLRVTTTPFSTGISETFPEDMVIGSVPTALVCESLQGLGPEGFIKNLGSVSQEKLSTLTSMDDASSLHHHDSLYLKVGSNINLGTGTVSTGTGGKIGIGTAQPEADVEIQNMNPQFRLENSGSGTSKIEFFEGSTERASIRNSAGGNKLEFYTGQDQVLEMDENQNSQFFGHLSVEGGMRGGQYDDASESTLVTDYLTPCGTACKGTLWVDLEDSSIEYWNGSAVKGVASVGGISTYVTTVDTDGTENNSGSEIHALQNVQTGVTNSGSVTGLLTSGYLNGGGTVDNSYGLRSISGIASGTNSGVAIQSTGVLVQVVNNGTSSTITNGFGIRVADVEADNAWGIYQDGNNDDNYFAGNVGIGTSSPSAGLHIDGATSQPGLLVSNSNTNSRDIKVIATGIENPDIFLTSTGTGDPHVAFDTGDVYPPEFSVGIDSSDAGKFKISAGVPGTNSRLTIDSGGKVGIGTTVPDQRLSVNGDASKIGGGSWTVFSDRRLKNIKGFYKYGLNEVLKLNPIHYRYKDENAMGIPNEKEHIGFIAQEVQAVIPEGVILNSKGYLMLNNDPIHWATLNAVKELHGMSKIAAAQRQSIKVRLDIMEMNDKNEDKIFMEQARVISSLKNQNNDLKRNYEGLKKRLDKLEKILLMK